MATPAPGSAAAAAGPGRAGPGFPGITPEETNAAWPGGHQPRPLEFWPQSADGMPQPCWKTSVLQDMHLDWPGKCRDLSRTEATNALECHESCAQDPLCAVWQYNYMTQCWHGIGRGCGLAEWEGSDLLATGAQRLQHGDVAVLWKFDRWQIFGLTELGDSSWGTWNHTFGAINCRAWCYSNLRCQFWQYAPGQCWVEDPGLNGIEAQYPLLQWSGATQDSTAAKDVMAGEYIARTCPPRPSDKSSAISQAVEAMGPGIGTIVIDVVVACLVLFAFARIWLRMRGYEQIMGQDTPKRKARAGGGEDDEGDGASSPSFFGRSRTHRKIQRYVPAPMLAVFMPTNIDPLLHGHFATVPERAAVCKALPDAPLPYANYLALRRTCTAALILLGTVSYVVQFRVLVSTYGHHRYFKAYGSEEKYETYNAWVQENPPNPSFLVYSKDKGLYLLAGILGEVLWGSFLIDLVVCTTELGPLILLSLAFWKWTEFSTSRKLIIRAWLVFFISAFVVSLFPVQSTLTFDRTERLADDYVHELAVALNLDKAQEFLLGSCEDIEADPKLADRIRFLGGTLKRTCSNLGKFPVELAVPCVGSMDICHVNLHEALRGCREAVQQFEVGHFEKAVSILQLECQRIRSAFTSPAKSDKQDKDKAFHTLVDMMRMPFHAIVPSIEIVSTTISALHSLFMVLPPVLGMAPGVMAAGFSSKVFAPHSFLPGAILIIVPVVLVSIGWLVQTVVFQYVSHSWILVLLSLVTLYPLVYIFIAEKYRLHLPTDVVTLQHAARAIVLSTLFMVVIVAVVVPKILWDFAFALEQMKSVMTLLAWCHVDWARLGIACGARSLYSFSLTFFAVADWIVGNIAVQQRYWRYWAKQGTLGSCAACRASGMTATTTASDDWALRRARVSQDEEYEAEVAREAKDHDLADFLWHRLARREALQRKAALAGDQTPSAARGSFSMRDAWGGLLTGSEDMFGTYSAPVKRAAAALAGGLSPSRRAQRSSQWTHMEEMRLTHHVVDSDESSADSASESK